MELFELKYFLGVAKEENIHRASEKLNVSPGSLSKAIGRLEEELSTQLFLREGRNIRLTPQGRLLQQKASEMIRLEETTRLEISGDLGSIQIVIAGPEVLLSKMGVEIAEKVRKVHPSAHFDFQACSETAAVEKINRGEAHLALITMDLPNKPGLTAKTLDDVSFQTYVGKGHPLYAAARAGKTVPVEEVLAFSFVSPDHPFLGKVANKQSLDGWRDDRFPRKVTYLTSSLKILEELVLRGQAIAYLPSYFCEGLPLEVLKVSGCPYTCSQKIKVLAKNPKETAWLRRLF